MMKPNFSIKCFSNKNLIGLPRQPTAKTLAFLAAEKIPNHIDNRLEPLYVSAPSSAYLPI